MGKLMVRVFLVAVLTATAFIFIKFKVWSDLSGQFDSLYEQNKYPEAFSVAEKQLKVAGDMFFLSNFFISPSLNNYGRVYYAERKFDEAKDYYRRALGVAESSFGKNSLRITAILENMAVLYKAMNDQEEAQKYLDRLEKIKAMNR